MSTQLHLSPRASSSSPVGWARATALRMVSVLAFVLAFVLTWGALAQTTARAEIIEQVVAVVNDEAVFLSQLRRRAAPFLESVVAGAPPAQRKARVDALYEKLLGQLIDEALIEQTAKELELSVSTLEIDQALDNVRRTNNMTDEQFWQAVAEQGFSKAQYRGDVRKQLLRLKVINQKVRSRISVGEAQVREEYDTRVRQARRSQRFRAAHLLVPLSEGAPATEVAEAMRKARKVRAALTPDNFVTTAEQHGGGELGWLDQGDLPQSLENALLDLDLNQISAPVRGPAGVHIFLLEERQAGGANTPSFEASRAGIQQELVTKAMERQEAIFLSELRKNAVIDTHL